MSIFCILPRICLFVSLIGFVQAADRPMSVPGLAVGAKAPSFTLQSAQGREVSLDTLKTEGPVALVFFRSADWCPYCIAQLKQLQARRADLAAAGVRLIGISYDSSETLVKAVAKHGLDLELLSDPGSKTIDAYGIRNEALKGRAAGVPHPTVFIVDGQGIIRAKLARDGYKDRPEVDEIIAAVRGLR